MAKKNRIYPIAGLWMVLDDLEDCPEGYHYDVWALCAKDACYIWTSDLLGQNEWSEDNNHNHVKLNSRMHEVAQNIKEQCGRTASNTEILRQVCGELREEYGFKEEE